MGLSGRGRRGGGGADVAGGSRLMGCARTQESGGARPSPGATATALDYLLGVSATGEGEAAGAAAFDLRLAAMYPIMPTSANASAPTTAHTHTGMADFASSDASSPGLATTVVVADGSGASSDGSSEPSAGGGGGGRVTVTAGARCTSGSPGPGTGR